MQYQYRLRKLAQIWASAYTEEASIAQGGHCRLQCWSDGNQIPGNVSQHRLTRYEHSLQWHFFIAGCCNLQIDFCLLVEHPDSAECQGLGDLRKYVWGQVTCTPTFKYDILSASVVTYPWHVTVCIWVCAQQHLLNLTIGDGLSIDMGVRIPILDASQLLS